MRLLNPWGLLALLLAVPIIILYMLRMHRQRVVVPSLLLWRAAVLDKRANRPWQKLQRNWLLFLQLLVLALLVMGLVQPALPIPAQVQGHTLILLDASASMQAAHAQGESRFDRARQHVGNAIASLRPTDRGTLIWVGTEARVVVQDGSLADLRRALDELTPSDGPADWRAAASLANAWAGATPTDHLNTLLVTDQAGMSDLPALPGDLRLVSVGAPEDNAGITAMALRRAGDGYALFAQVTNAGDATQRDVQLIVDGIPQIQQGLDLAADGALSLSFDIDNIEDWVELRLIGGDSLSLDDRAWVALTMGAGQGIALVANEENLFLERVLNAMPGLEMTMVTPGTVLDGYNTVVIDGANEQTQAQSEMDVWYIAPQINTPCGQPTGTETNTQVVYSHFEHPLVHQVDWPDVHIAKMSTYILPDDAQVLASAGDNPVLWLVDRSVGCTVCLSFDLHASDFPLRVAFPVLTANIMGWLQPDQSVLPMQALKAGHSWTPDLPPQSSAVHVTLPNGTYESYTPGEPLPGLVGLYRFDIQEPDESQQYTAVSLLDADESDLRPGEVTVEGSAVLALQEAQPVWRTFTPWLLGITLVLLLLEAGLWWGQSWAGWQTLSTQGLQIALRLLLITAVLAALLDLRVQRKTHDLNLVLLVDRSASTRGTWQSQETFIAEVVDAKGGRDRVGIIAFGAEAWVDQPLSIATGNAIHTAVDGSATDLESAVRLALPMLPENAPSRLLIMSDGLENQGDALLVLRQAQAAGVDVQFTPWTSTPAAEVWVEAVHLPGTVSVGEVVPVHVTLRGNQAQPLNLTVTTAGHSDGADIAFNGPSQAWNFSLEAGTPGFMAVEVCISGALDREVVNNCAYGWTMVQGAPRVLLVGTEQDTVTLHAALLAAGLDVKAISAGELPITAVGLTEYATVVLANTPARDLSVTSMEALRDYVQRYGGGLLTVGGDHAYGVGGWLGTPLEQALPVQMYVQDPRRFPPLSVVVVIDTSGSMAAVESGTPKIELAAEAAARVVETLNDMDTVAVVAFDDRPTDIIGPLQATQRDEILSQISRLKAGGGGIYVYDSLRVATQLLIEQENETTILQHIILLADGSDAEQQEGAYELAEAIGDAGVTISTVSLGWGLDTHFLEQLAEKANGRAYVTGNASDLPAIFAEDTARAKRSYIVEQLFVPEVVSTWAPLSDIDAVPSLLGYVATAPKPTAQVVWNATEGDPLLAVWQFGLGKAASWTSDAGSRWTQTWTTWQDMQAFWGSITRAVMAPAGSPGTVLSVVTREGTAYAVADVYTDGLPVDGLTLDVQTADGDLLMLEQVAPGRYEAPLPSAEHATVAMLRLSGDRDAMTGWSAEIPRESLPGDGQAAVARLAASLDAEIIEDARDVVSHDMTGTQQGVSLVRALLWLAACLWVVDIAARRLGWRLRRPPKKVRVEEQAPVVSDEPVEEQPETTIGALRKRLRK